MKKLLLGISVSAFVAMSSVAAMAASYTGWTLVNKESRVSYGSIKKNTVGESNYFNELSGMVSADGHVMVTINLASVETWVDKRNERLIKYVFGGDAGKAKLSTMVDMESLNALAVGETTTIDIKGTLDFAGVSVDIQAPMFVARLGEKKVLVMTDELIMLGADEINADAGLDKLQELAKLPGITHVIPVSLRFVFTQ